MLTTDTPSRPSMATKSPADREVRKSIATNRPPHARDSHISATDTSKPKDVNPAHTSSGDMSYSPIIVASNASTARWDTATPLGTPVVPEVYMTYAGSPGSIRVGNAGSPVSPSPPARSSPARSLASTHRTSNAADQLSTTDASEITSTGSASATTVLIRSTG